MKAKQDIYLVEDRSRAVTRADKDARWLLVKEGQEITEETLAKHEGAAALAGAGGSKSAPRADAPEKIQTREPAAEHRDPKHRKH